MMKTFARAMLAFACIAILGGLAVALSPPEAHAVELFAAMAVVQSAYAENLTDAVAGMIANMTTSDVDTRSCEDAAGIGFGLPVGQGTADKGAVIAGALNLFVGVSVRDVTLVNATVDKYADNQNMGVLTKGDIWVTTSVAALPSDPVHYNATTGAWLITGGSGPIVGARWMRSSGIGGLNVLRLTGNLPVA